jgi:DNA helicase-2/ATP-dependent DNA helicase PcrA
MTDSLKFKRYYVALNPEQKRAVDTVEGPVFVVAGPGTGKTQVLTLRIANILRQTDTPPDGILALTFTNAGVAAMRERLVEIAGAAGYRVAINTFHGFCNELIGRFPERFPRIIGGAPVGKVERVRIMEKLIETLPLKRWRPAGAPFYYLQPLLAALDRWKKDNQPPKERELALIYRGYQKELARRQRYDFADMITEVVAVLKKETGFRRQLQEEYLYLLADEHQDANAAQNELLRLLADYHARPNLFIVGDEKQAIFQFQGASLENFNYFKKLYPDASLIRLTQNYRSGQPLLDGAHALMSRSGLPAEILTPLRSQAGASAEKIRVATLPNPVAEQQFLVSEIKARLAAGVAPGALAVIYRDNADGRPFQLALEAAGVPLNVRSETDLLADRTVAQLILVLETIHHFGADHYLKQFLHLDFLKLDSLAVYHLLAEPLPLYPRLKKAPGALGELFKKLERWHRLAHNQNLLELFGVVLEETGFLAFLLKAPAAEESLAKLQSFYEELKELALTKSNYDLADFMDYLATLRRHDLKLSVTAGAGQAGVALLTAHKAKGLEFDYVYLVGATESRWGERRSRAGGLDETSLETEPASEGERRLFYVALTRARRGITVSYAHATRDGRPQPPTRFIEEIDKNLVERLAPVIKTPPLQVLTARPPRAPKLAEKSYLNQLFRDAVFP